MLLDKSTILPIIVILALLVLAYLLPDEIERERIECAARPHGCPRIAF